MDFEEVTYWDEIGKSLIGHVRMSLLPYIYVGQRRPDCIIIMEFLNIRWKRKMFGIFEHRVLEPFHSIFRGFDDCFYVPHSRHTEVRREDILKVPELTLLPNRKRPVSIWRWHGADVSSLSRDTLNILR